jgi:threonine/homoserine/homoserine lactone efflux protein
MRKALLTNFLNPHPYVFWVTVGGPLVVQASELGPNAVGAFLVGFFGGLVGVKILIAFGVYRARAWLTGPGYVRVMRTLSIAMWGFATWMGWEGVVRLISG